MRSFVEYLAELAGGALLTELEQRLSEVVLAVQEHEKKGELTLRLTLVPNRGTVVTQPEVKVKKPGATLSASIHYATGDGSLQRDNPDQPDMFSGKKIRSVN